LISVHENQHNPPAGSTLHNQPSSGVQDAPSKAALHFIFSTVSGSHGQKVHKLGGEKMLFPPRQGTFIAIPDRTSGSK